MLMLPLVSKRGTPPVVGPDFEHARMPLFYMNDFSRLGLRVHPCDEALDLMAEHRFGIIRDDGGDLVVLEKAAQLPLLVELLTRHGIACEIADLAEAIYQG
jgi:hypothetical protein